MTLKVYRVTSFRVECRKCVKIHVYGKLEEKIWKMAKEDCGVISRVQYSIRTCGGVRKHVVRRGG